MAQTNILLIYTGGTIGMVRDYANGALRPFDFSAISQHIPELEQLECAITAVSMEKPQDSSNIGPAEWVELAQIIGKHYDGFDGFVVLHGSDTMSYTASALSYMLEHLAKPVVFTGSQLPIGDLRTDAKENLITSIQIASLVENDLPIVREVCLYFEYKLYRGNRTTKMSAEHFNAFDSPNYPPLAESGVDLAMNIPYLWREKSRRKLEVHTQMDHRVGLVKLFPGMDREWLETMLFLPSRRALVLETYGAGNAPNAKWFTDLLKEALKRGVHIINVTQCPAGTVRLGHYETSLQLAGAQIIDGKDITTEAALTKLMYLLGSQVSEKSFKTLFETSLRGEVTQN